MANYTFLAAQNYRTNRKKEVARATSSSDYRKDEENARLARIEAIQRLRNGTAYNPTLLHTAEKMASDDTKEKFSNTKTTLDSVTTAKSAASTHSKKSPAITAGTTSSLMESAKSKSQPSAGASLSAITTAKSSAKKNQVHRNNFSSVTADKTLLEKSQEPVTEEQATRRKAYSIYNGLDEETYKKANEAYKAADVSAPSAARQRTAVANALMESGISKEKAVQYAKNWGNVQGAKGIIDDARYESSVNKRVNELSDDQYKELGNYIVRTDPKYYFDHPDLLDDSKPYYGQWESVDEYKQKFMDTYGVSEDEFDIYVDAAKRKLKKEATEREEQKRQENMDKYPWATMAYNVEDLATGFIADGMAATTTAIAKLTGRQIDPYDYGFRQQRLNAAVEQKSAEQFADLVGKLGGGETAQNIAAGAYSVGNSIIKSKMAMDMGTGVADSLGLVKGTSQYRNIASLTNSGLFSASAFSNSVRESKDAGLSDEQALRTGVANGINESLMEYLSFDKVLGLLDKPGKVTIKEGVKRFMGAMFAEGSEELNTDLANTIADHLMNGEFEDTKNQVSYLVANGMDEETAKEQVWSDTLKQWTEDFIAGAISGGVFAGGRIASSNINYHNLADNVSVELKEQLAETSKTMEEGTTAREIAESKPVEEWTRDDTAKVLQSMEEIAGEKGNYEDILAHEIEKTGKGSEEAKTIAQDMVKAASTSSEDTTEEDSARRIETWDEGTQETYGKFLRGELTRESDTVASAYEVRESPRQEKQRGNSKTTVARAYEKSSNNPVIAVKISDITKSDAKVMLSDGSTTKLSEIRFDDRQTQQLYNLASTFESSNAANAFIEEFPGGDVATYARSVMAYYNAGRNGAKSFDSLMGDSQNGIYAAVDSSINRTFYELGVNDKTPVKAVTKPQADTVSRGKVIDQRTEVTPDSDFVTRVASVLSNADYENTVIKDTKLDNNARGEFNRILAEVAITTDSDNPLSAVVHEHIGEVSRAYNAEGWDKVVDEVMDYMYSKEGMQWVNNRVSTYKEAYKKVSSNTDNRDAATEFVNDVIGEIFTTEEGLEHLMNHAQEKLTEKEQKSFIQSIKDFFNNMIKSLKDYMESHSRRFSRSEYLKASKQLEKIRDDALAAWDKAIENRKREMSGENKGSTVKAAEKKFALELEESAKNITPLLNTDYETLEKTNVSIVEMNSELDSKYVTAGKVSISKIIEDQLKLCEHIRPGKTDLYYVVFDKINGLKAQISGKSIKHSINITDGTIISKIDDNAMNDIVCYSNLYEVLKNSVCVGSIVANKKHSEKGMVLYGVARLKDKGTFLVRTTLEHREGAGYEIAKVGIVENIRAIKTQQVEDMHWKNNSATLRQPADSVTVSELLDYVKNNITAKDSIQIQLVQQLDEMEKASAISGSQQSNVAVPKETLASKLNVSSDSKNINKRYSLNVDSEGNELSDQQQEYFKDSKVRDENGKLKPVYHGTGSQFNVFSYDFIGKTGSAEGYGFYFTDQIEKAKGYSKRGTDVMSGYLNITKPLSTSELTLTENEIRGLLLELDPTGDEILANFEYTGEGYPSKQWYNKAMKETIDTLMENESDDDVLAEIVNSGSDNETVLTTVRNLYGYDGYIVEDKYEDGNVYVAFSSEQFKNADNRQPTPDKDIRFSIEIANDEYKEAEDSELYDIAKRIYDSGTTSKKAYYKLSETLPERLVNDIKEILNIDVSDYGNEISETSIAHINRRHGPNGSSDHSMEDVHNVARIEYAIENYAEIEEGARSKEYRNRDGSYSKTIVMRANIGSDFYYVVEAVPDAKIKTLHVVSAYINKNDTFSDVVVSNDPNRYVQDEHRPNVSFPKSNVSSDRENVNKRYSLNLENEGKKYSTNIDEALFEALEETWTLEEQKQASGIVQQGFEALQSVEINDRIVNKIAKNILKQYSSDYSTEDLSYNIKNIFAYLKNTENVSFDDMTKVMQEVAKPVLEQSKRIDQRDKADYDDFINYLSQKRIKLTSAQRQEVEYTYGSYDAFRKSMFGKVTLSNKGVSLDDIWSEIVQQSGYRLSEDVSDADEITALAEVIEDMKPVPRNPFGMDMDDAAYDVALDIYRQFFIEQAAEKANEKVKKVIGQKTDQLIEKQQQYRRKYGQMYMEAVAKERRKTEELQKASIARLQGEFYKLDQAERDAIRESDLISQAVIKAEREKYEGRLRRLRNQKNDKIAEIRARNANSRTKAAQQRRAAYLKEGIRKNMDSLNSMLMHPNENKHIPAGMVRSVIDVCEAVNVDTGKSRLMKEKLEKLQGFYESYRNDDQFSFDYDERIDKDIDTLKNMFAGRNYTELTNDELQRVYNIVNALKQQISNANKLIDNKLVKDAHEGAMQAVEEVTRAKRHANNVVTYNLDKFASYHLNAYREFRKLSGYKENSVLMSIYDELERGQQKELEIQRHVNDAFLGLLQSNRKEAMRLESYKPDDLVDIGLKDENGKPVMVTRAMRLSVIMHSYNKGNMNHVLNEGLTIPDIKLYEKGNIKEAWEKAKTYRYVSYELMLDAIKSKDSERLTEEQAKYERSVRKLESDLSDFEKEFLKIAKEVFHNYFGKEINKVTMQTRGYAAARVENYYPIKTDPDFTHSNFGGLVMDSSLEGMGMLKERVRSKNPILLEDITKVVIRQANNTSKYVGYAIPIRNFNMLMNSTFHDSNGRIRNMKETVRNVWGNSNEKYLENIFKDIQGARKTESGIMDNLRSSFAGATLTLNVSVAMKQAASYPTAASVVGYGPLLKAMKDIPKGFNFKKGIPELEKRNSLLWVRSQGYSNERIADTTQTSAMKSKAKEKLDWISFMDIGTVRTLEYASMYYVDSNFKNLKKGSDEYWDKVSETFTKVVAETQPNYTTLQQAAVTRDPNKFMKQIIMFKTQSLQNFGIVYDAVGNYNAKSIALKEAKKTNSAELIATAKKEKMQAAKNLVNATTSQIVAAAVFNAMTILSKLMLHKWKPFQDDDGEWSSEKLMNFFMVGMVDTLSGSIIWGSEIADVLEALLLGETYYGTEVSVIEMWNDCNNAIINLHNNINKMNGAQTDEEYDKYNYKVQTSILTLVTTLGQFKGVPVNNVYNMFNAVYTYAAGTSIMNGDVEKQYDRIVDAYLDGDTKEYKRLYEQKANTLSNPDSAKSGTKSTIKERYLNGEMSQEQAESFLNDLGYDDAYFTIKEWDYTNETGEKYLQYGELDSAIEDAVKSGDRQSVIDAVKDLTDHGIKESSVESHISKTFKPIYQESHSKANLKSYLITAYEYCGVPRDKAMEKIKAWEEER